jgi:hypothetical protein
VLLTVCTIRDTTSLAWKWAYLSRSSLVSSLQEVIGASYQPTSLEESSFKEVSLSSVALVDISTLMDERSVSGVFGLKKFGEVLRGINHGGLHNHDISLFVNPGGWSLYLILEMHNLGPIVGRTSHKTLPPKSRIRAKVPSIKVPAYFVLLHE